MVFVVATLILALLLIEFKTRDSIPWNAEQLEGLFQHGTQELRVKGRKVTSLRSPHSVTVQRHDGSEPSMKFVAVNDKRYQLKNEVGTHEDDKTYDLTNTEKNNEDMNHMAAVTENNENEGHSGLDKEGHIGVREGDDALTASISQKGAEDDSRDYDKTNAKVLSKFHGGPYNFQDTRDVNSPSRKTSKEAASFNPRLLTSITPDKVLTSTFIPNEPETSPLRQPPDIPKRFLIEEADYCQRRPKLQIIAYVHSSILRARQRTETRSTWGNASVYDMGPMNVSIGVVFMVGRAKNDLERRIVQEESERYHDIVQGDYGDHYRLLTYKGLAGLYWINQHCAHVPWFLHSDDDTHIDIFLYYRALQQLDKDSKEKFICSFMYGPALRFGRYKVRYEEYPAKEYPLYCSGGVWFLQTRFIPRLLEASKTVPYLWVDDAYITGLLARRAGIKHFPFQNYYGGPHVYTERLGKEVVWFVKLAPRSVWWQNIVHYHRKNSMLKPATLPLLQEKMARAIEEKS